MEFKVVIYILIVIGYFIYNNYKKIVAENQKRKFSNPEEYSPPPVVVERAGEAKPIPHVLPKPPARTFTQQEKKPSVFKPLQKVKPVYKPLQKKPVPILIRDTAVSSKKRIDSFIEGPLISSENLTTQNSIAEPAMEKNYNWFFTMSKSELQRAFVIGQVLNEPAYIKY